MTSTTFWHTLPRPILALSPMDGVTDQPYRYLQKKYGPPMLIYTEFTSAEGLCLSQGRLLRDLLYDETQRPIIAQIFGKRPDFFYQAAIIVCELGFDGFDINMGCPSKTVAQGGSGAALIRTPQLAQEIVRAAQQGVRDWQNGATVYDCPDLPQRVAHLIVQRKAQLPLAYQQRRPIPVSVKTRIGYETPIVDEWLPYLLDVAPVAIGIHGRTLEQGYGGEASWEEIGRAVEVARGSGILILGNGDIASLPQAHQRVQTYGVDGVLVGRATYGNPFFFDPTAESFPTAEPPEPAMLRQFAQLMVEHAQMYEATYQHYEKYFFSPMRKHLGWYARNMHGGKKLRIPLMQTNSPSEVMTVLAQQGYWAEPVTRPVLAPIEQFKAVPQWVAA
ncbi:MAG TPA: tRNA-dihydrouridine synthase [Caldilineaceae bacterium]|nr:tRNA-dihydrouridine synthase [Caldilineaceae bacterium]